MRMTLTAIPLLLVVSACGGGVNSDAGQNSSAGAAGGSSPRTSADRSSEPRTPGPTFGKGPPLPAFKAMSEAIGSVKPADRARVLAEAGCITAKMDPGEVLRRRPSIIRDVASRIAEPGFRSAC